MRLLLGDKEHERGGIMEEVNTFSSPAIAKKMERTFGSSAKKVKIELLHEKEARDYVMSIEEAHKKAAKSKTTFP
jgi:hypothetical protein